MKLPHLRHAWQTEAAVRHCGHAWSGPDLGHNVIPWVSETPDRTTGGTFRHRPRHLTHYPGTGVDGICFADLYQVCARQDCNARRRHQVTQPPPPPRDPWIDDGVLPRAVPTEGR